MEIRSDLVASESSIGRPQAIFHVQIEATTAQQPWSLSPHLAVAATLETLTVAVNRNMPTDITMQVFDQSGVSMCYHIYLTI